MKSDWLRNIQSDSNVMVRVGSRRFNAEAEIIQDLVKIADFLTFRLHKHPRFIGTIMRMEGFPKKPSREDLEAYAANRVMVILHPMGVVIR
jgi:hypothetical protein